VLQFFIDLLHQGHPEFTKGNDPTISQLVQRPRSDVEKKFEDERSVRCELHGVLGSVFAATGNRSRAAGAVRAADVVGPIGVPEDHALGEHGIVPG
jgi:hypothetical protein